MPHASSGTEPRLLSDEARSEKLQRMLYREFLLEPELYHDAGLDDLPIKLGKALGCSPRRAIEQLTNSPELEEFSLGELTRLITLRDAHLLSRTTAKVEAKLAEPDSSYDGCIRRALCFAVGGMREHVFSALRAAGEKRDDWARHHFIYGLMHAIAGDAERALWELEMALQREPYEDGRVRIHHAIELLREDNPQD